MISEIPTRPVSGFLGIFFINDWHIRYELFCQFFFAEADVTVIILGSNPLKSRGSFFPAFADLLGFGAILRMSSDVYGRCNRQIGGSAFSKIRGQKFQNKNAKNVQGANAVLG